ncbi:MAG: hydrogenase maturation nickel metallochaperone HypA [Phycisphaerales bacterium]|nr:hydrogenase maturation nickel metallochaperone HypA [Phycisphaerales bacterium]
MHELSVATNIVRLACEAVEDAGSDDQVASVKVRIGALAGIVTESLIFAWDVAAEGTKCEHAQIQIEEVPGKIKCPSCEQITTLSHPPRFICASCGTKSGDVVAGHELDILSLELADEPTNA